MKPPCAPKIVAFEIPLDKIGEVIGPKGKVINAIQQETGADIAVDDDGMVGTVTIGAKESIVVNEARRRIELILDPPIAEVGKTYPGKVVNITKFGAFVNILPGRDGLLHISKLGGGKRIERVEDVLALGQVRSRVSSSTTSIRQGKGLALARRRRRASSVGGTLRHASRRSPAHDRESERAARRESADPLRRRQRPATAWRPPMQAGPPASRFEDTSSRPRSRRSSAISGPADTSGPPREPRRPAVRAGAEARGADPHPVRFAGSRAVER